MSFSNKLFFTASFIAILALNSCKNDENSSADLSDQTASQEANPKRTFNNAFDGKLYSVPSALQTIVLINSLAIPFDSTFLFMRTNNNPYPNYTSQAFHLGFYYVDIAYMAIYDQKGECLKYLEPMKELAINLETTTIFSPSFTENLRSNIEKKDSLLMLFSSHFSEFDYYLKEHDKKNISSLILAGGWLKSMYIVSQVYKKNKNNLLLQHLGHQKHNLETVIQLIEKHNTNGQNDDYLKHFTELNELYEKVNLHYEYMAPITDKENRVTTISKGINAELSEELSNKIIECISKTYSKIAN